MTAFRHRRIVFMNISPIFLVAACSMCGCGPRKEPLPVSAEEIAVPYQEITNATLFSYDGPRKNWRLDAEYMKKNLDDTAKILVAPVRITLFDSSGNPGTRILSDSGNTKGDMESFLVWGDVYINTHDGKVIQTQKLWWDKETHLVHSDTYVQITTPNGDVLRGKGLDGREDFSRWTFKSEVSGKFPDFRKRAEADDSFF